MQVYASYRYRRDLVEAAKVPGALTHTRLLTVRIPAHTSLIYVPHLHISYSCISFTKSLFMHILPP